MLDKLRAQALKMMAAKPACTLATSGPAGLQASLVSLKICELQIFIEVPITSDHLFNLEHQEEVVLTAGTWQLRGKVKSTDPVDQKPGSRHPGVNAHRAVVALEVIPVQMHIEPTSESDLRKTIDWNAS